MADEAERVLVALVADATRGADRAIAVELARAGYFAYATGRSSRAACPSELGRPETIEETGDLSRAAGGAGAARVVDHEDPSQVAALVTAIDDERGRLDVLVNDIFGGDRYMQWDKPLWEHDWQGGLRMLQMGVHTHLIRLARFPAARNHHGRNLRKTRGRAERPRPCVVGRRHQPEADPVWTRRSRIMITEREAERPAFVEMGDVARLAEALAGVRLTAPEGLTEWRYHGRLVARQLDDAHLVIRADFDYRDSMLRQFPETFSVPTRYIKHMMVVADLARGDAGAIEDALETAWQLQRGAD